jgi:probable HAF family extracellular repeat protein
MPERDRVEEVDMRKSNPITLAAAALLISGAGAGATNYQFHTIAPPSGAPTGLFYYAFSLNDNGQLLVTGEAPNVTWNFTLVNDLYTISTNTYTPLPPNPSATPNSTSAEGINNSGQIVGYYHPSGLGWQGFSYSGGVFTDVNPAGGIDNIAYGISNNGQIVGMQGDFPATQAYLYSGGGYTTIEGAPYPTDSSQAFGVNNSGTVVGEWGNSAANELTNSFVYSGGVVTQLVVPGSQYTGASGINDAGLIVGGVSNDLSFDTGSGFIDDNGVYSFVNVPGATDTFIYNINNLDEIVGGYTDANGNAHMFYATPTGVPELSTWAMLLSGFAALALTRRLRRHPLR